MCLLSALCAWAMYRDHFSREAARDLVKVRASRKRSLHTGRRVR